MPKILIVAKQSMYEYEQENLGLSHDGLVEKYKSEHANFKAILSSHGAQVATREEIKKLLPDAEMIMMDKKLVTTSGLKGKASKYDMIISLGGDNSFTYVSHYAEDTPIVSINSDPTRSIGALCGWSSKDLKDVVSRIKSGKYAVEKWPRLDVEIDGKKTIPATSEFYFGRTDGIKMSRHILVYKDQKHEHKCTSIIFSLGAGSTGWYHSASHDFWMSERGKGDHFAKTDNKAKFFVREPYRYEGEELIRTGEILPGETVTLHSLNKEGTASPDSWERYDFGRGKTAVISLAEKPLNVIVPE